MNQFKMGIHGMTCAGCEEHIEKVLESIGATNLQVNFRRSCVLQDFPTQYCKEKVHTFAPEIFL